MQFFWKYIDDLMGKGLSVNVILELLLYISASLIPLALPLAILLSSIMTLGNLSENNELTALKSSGLSLFQILKPLTSIVLIIAITTFFFANYVIPVANLKLHSLIFDIQNTKIANILTPGRFSTELDGFAIKIKEETNGIFKEVLIHDHSNPKIIKTVRAESGKIYKTDNGADLFFQLNNGFVMEELNPITPIFDLKGNKVINANTYPARRSKFKQATFKIDLTGFELNRSDEDLFRNKHEMLNVFQIDDALDSIQKRNNEILKNFISSIENDFPFIQAIAFKKHLSEIENGQINAKVDSLKTLNLNTLPVEEKINVLTRMQVKIRQRKKNLESQLSFLNSVEKDLDGYLIEFHRKLALTVAIIILFFVGAPLGAIVKKGGFGAPVVIAALLFLVYFVLLSIGEGLAKSGTVSPIFGMWLPALVLAPIAFRLMYSASNDQHPLDFQLIKAIRNKIKASS